MPLRVENNPEDQTVITASNLPPFMQLTDLNNGMALVEAISTPSAADAGVYIAQFFASD